MRTKILVALFVLLASVSQVLAAQDTQSKNVPAQNDTQSKDTSKKDAPAQGQDAANSKIEKPDVHEFVMANFRTESGATLPQARIVYGTR